MILGLYQCSSAAGDIAAGMATLNDALEQAKAAGVDMLTLPELLLPGYVAAVAGADVPPDMFDQVAALVATHGVAVTVGLLESDPQGNRYNSAYVFGPDGEILARHRKLQLFGPEEAAIFTQGNAYVTFDYGGKCFGLLICYDLEFPEHVRSLAKLGAEIILVPTANMMPFVNVPQIIGPARAMENAVTVVYGNYCGTEGQLTYTGLSAIFGPDGYILGSKGRDTGLCIAEVPEGWSEHGIPLSTQGTDFRRIAPWAI